MEYKSKGKIVVFAYKHNFEDLVNEMKRRNDPRVPDLEWGIDVSDVTKFGDSVYQIWNYDFSEPSFDDVIYDVVLPNAVIYLYHVDEIPEIET